MIRLLRPCCVSRFPDGAQFGEWGQHWGYRFNDKGIWVKGQVMRDGVLMGIHAGRDIKCEEGTLLVAPSDVETVLRAGWQDEEDHQRGYGLSVIFQLAPMEYEPGKFARLILTVGHLSDVWCRPGHHLARGDAFGKSGNTGNSSGPHTHIQLELPDPGYPRTPIDFEWVCHF
jgi:murein DD-endopeptidase MepM/ murein hydrolase activator NlpD